MIQKIEQSAPAVNPASDPEVRKTMVGATDAAAILGVSPWRTAVDVWMEKTGRIEPADLSDVEAIRIGNVLEGPVAELYTMETGRELARPVGTSRHPDYHFVACHPDFIAPGGLVECKTFGIANPMTKDKRDQWGDDDSDQVPTQYLVQCHYQMLVTGAAWVDLAALIGGQGLRIFRVDRDEAFCQHMLKTVVDFWENHVIADVAPEPVNLGDCKLLYPEDDGSTVQGGDEHVELIRQLHALKASKKETEAHIASVELQIKKAMGDAYKLEVGGQIVATWGVSYQDRVDSKALRAKYPEIARECSNSIATRRFLPKKIKEVA